MLTLEKDVESYLKRKVESVGGLCLKLPAVYCEGIPDRLVIFPGGHAVFVELKRPRGGILSPIQKYQHARLRKVGCRVEVISTKEGIDTLMEEIDNELHTTRLPEIRHSGH